MELPETRYARIGDDRIAYQVMGEGPDIIYFSGMLSHTDIRWEHPSLAGFSRRLASFSRLICFDRRGSGVSDALRPGQAPTWELFVEDVRAVLDDVGSERACVFGVLDAGPTAILFAASHPDRTSGLILGNTVPKFVASDDYPHGLPPEAAQAVLDAVREEWGTQAFAHLAVPSRQHDPAFVRWYAKFQRASTRPRDAAAYLDGILRMDVRDALATIQVPALIFHSKEYAMMPIAHARYMASTIEGARLIELPGADGVLWTDNAERVATAVEEFVTGTRRGSEVDRVLATVMFTDIVQSTERAASLGDHRWRDVIVAHDDMARTTVSLYGGRVVKTTGDGILATFDGPARALRCVAELRSRVESLGLQMRAGLHTGEIELRGDDIAGIAVHIAARVMGEAEPGQIWTTSTVRDLVFGSEIDFADRGARTLKGVPGEWRLSEAMARETSDSVGPPLV